MPALMVDMNEGERFMLSRYCVAATLVLAAAVDLIPTGALATSVALGSISPITDPAKIQKLAEDAYIWGVAPEFVYRFGNYNELVSAPVNTFGAGQAVAAWNNQATNAGNASALYMNAMLDLSGQKGRGATKELVLTVPPSETNYYVVALLDAFINEMGSIGTRTTPSTGAQTYLLAGPTSRYAHERIAQIHGFTYRVMPFDTNRDWMLIRIRADSLVPASDPTSVASIIKSVVERFGLSTLAEFEARGHRPKYFEPGQYTPTPEQIERAAKVAHRPDERGRLLQASGRGAEAQPAPRREHRAQRHPAARPCPAGSSHSPVPPYSTATRPMVKRRTLALFKPLGLTANGFTDAQQLGPRADQRPSGRLRGRADTIYAKTSSSARVTQATNYWSYRNSGIGTYPNTPQGYVIRAVFTFDGGSANMPQDDVYAAINNLDGTSATQLDGNNTYKLTFTPPVTNPPTLAGRRYPAADHERQPGQSAGVLVDHPLPARSRRSPPPRSSPRRAF